MRVPFKKKDGPAVVRQLDPELAAEQRRRVVEYGRTDAELETDAAPEDPSRSVAKQAAEENGASAGSQTAP